MQAAPTLRDYPPPGADTVRGGRRFSGAAPDTPPLVSVITVVLNGARTLPRAARSVLAQDVRDVEYIVIDGGSTDGTLDLLRGFGDRIAAWTSARDRGISDAFNKGIALARGRYVGLLNCDDWYEDGALRAVADAFAHSEADIVHGQLQYWEHERRTYLVTGDAALLETGMTVGHPSVFVRREYYERIGLFRLDYRQAMDYEWLLRAHLAGARFQGVDRCLVNMQGGGIGDRFWRRSQVEVARARALHLPGARGAFAFWRYVTWAVAKGTVRRALDGVGLSALRRWYHRRLARVRIVATRH